MMKKNWHILLVLAGALGLRLISLSQSFWLDEATSATAARDLSWQQLFGSFAAADFHPSGYYALLKIWGAAFGYSEVALRMPSVLFGVFTVYGLYRLGKLVANDQVGLLAALLLAVSGLHVYYSQEARAYALSAFIVTWCVYFFAKVFVKPTKRDLAWLSMLLFLLPLTDYLPLVFVPTLWIYALVNGRSKQWWRKFTFAHIPLLLGLLLMSPTLTSQLGSGLAVADTSPLWYQILGRTTLKELVLIPVKFMIGRISFESPLVYGLVVILIGLIFASLLIKAWLAKKGSFDWYWLVLPILFAAVIAVRVPVLTYFRLLFVVPALYLLLAKGIVELRPSLRSLVSVVLMAIGLASSGYYLLTPKFQREDWRGLVGFIDEHSKQSSVVLFVAGSQMEAYKFYSPRVPAVSLAGFGGSEETVWLMRYVQPIFDPADAVRAQVEDLGYAKQAEYDFNGVVVWEYAK